MKLSRGLIAAMRLKNREGSYFPICFLWTLTYDCVNKFSFFSPVTF